MEVGVRKKIGKVRHSGIFDSRIGGALFELQLRWYITTVHEVQDID